MKSFIGLPNPITSVSLFHHSHPSSNFLIALSKTLLSVFGTLFPPISGLSLNKFLHHPLQHLFHSTHCLFHAVRSSPASKHTSSLFHTPLNSPPSSPIYSFQPVSSAPLVHEWAPENTPTPLVLRGLYKVFIYLLTLLLLNANDIVVPNQFTFREKYSTHLAILKLVDDISEQLNNKNYCIGIFIDLSTAFYTINHKLLITRLLYYGIRGIVLDWFISYLSNGTQYVNINNSISFCLPIKCEVPQGSILGPLLLIFYINDIVNVNVSKLAKYIMFADDTNLFFSNIDLNLLYKIINYELSLISNWFKLDKLSLNIKKINYILFCSGNYKIDNKGLDILINNTKFDQVIKTKFLGVVSTENLNWNEHIKIISCKLSKILVYYLKFVTT